MSVKLILRTDPFALDEDYEYHDYHDYHEYDEYDNDDDDDDDGVDPSVRVSYPGCSTFKVTPIDPRTMPNPKALVIPITKDNLNHWDQVVHKARLPTYPTGPLSTATFHCFPLLSTELRYKIWGMTVEPYNFTRGQIVSLDGPHGPRILLDYDRDWNDVDIFSICPDSRAAAISLYGQPDVLSCPFNPETDRITFRADVRELQRPRSYLFEPVRSDAGGRPIPDSTGSYPVILTPPRYYSIKVEIAPQVHKMVMRTRNPNSTAAPPEFISRVRNVRLTIKEMTPLDNETMTHTLVRNLYDRVFKFLRQTFLNIEHLTISAPLIDHCAAFELKSYNEDTQESYDWVRLCLMDALENLSTVPLPESSKRLASSSSTTTKGKGKGKGKAKAKDDPRAPFRDVNRVPFPRLKTLRIATTKSCLEEDHCSKEWLMDHRDPDDPAGQNIFVRFDKGVKPTMVGYEPPAKPGVVDNMEDED
ncbi:hypothetical protein B0T19DRAFT_479995 [Cercophora scortea]|uniref:2EXR domain-containing protein n=1 Tax=Cercophora scortea TaxID=314031 RepID=A0AAE0J1I5_9PEZI|nr:hypothetical protein B0T19DRAFT_479995 [Cercophora scortea]